MPKGIEETPEWVPQESIGLHGQRITICLIAIDGYWVQFVVEFLLYKEVTGS